jgi:hypothetical protein
MVQKNEYEPACVGVIVCVVVQGPTQVACPAPGSEKPRLWSTPASSFSKVTVRTVPAFTVIVERSNLRSWALIVMEAAAGGAGGTAVGVGAGGDVGAGVGGGGVDVAVGGTGVGVALGTAVLAWVAI